MARFKDMVASPAGSTYILQGNEAFALGVVHAGYHAADGYPGTPSTEVIDKSLVHVKDRMIVGWSVNEATAVAVTVGHAVAGFDAVVTMKVPGVFQAGDVISTSAFYTEKAGAFVIYVATDYAPSSTQHVIDPRYFFSSCNLPVLEPRSHQEMYDIPRIAADLSREFKTPVVVLASGILCHSEGRVVTQEPRTVSPLHLPENLHAWMIMPAISRANYNKTVTDRMPHLQKWTETSALVSVFEGDDMGMIVNGEAEMIVREALLQMGLNPSILSLAITNPIPKEQILAFARRITGKLFIIEDGHRFLDEKIRLLGIETIGKDAHSTLTDWTPEDVIRFLSSHLGIPYKLEKKVIDMHPLKRPPSICPGCPYRAFGLAVGKLKQKKKIYAAFGDIGCSTLLYFLNALDTVLCMGASDAVRQGFVLSRPDMAHQVISIIGDSCECHSGLDATRNAIFRHTPGVKVILDNRITAMTGGQPAPSSSANLDGVPNKFVLKDAVAAEKARTVTVDSYNVNEVEHALTQALELAEKGEFTTLILQGECIQEADAKNKTRTLRVDEDSCKKCGLCDICPGISRDDSGKPAFTLLCTNCGSKTQVCRQRCPFGAIVPITEVEPETAVPEHSFTASETGEPQSLDKQTLPPALRVAVRGIGGQGNLFFGKVLTEVARQTPYSATNIIKGDTHGMAQLGGPVISTFACGTVYSPVLAPHSVDVLVTMEVSEVLRPGFLNLLKPGGTLILNLFKAIPVTSKKEEYPEIDAIMKLLDQLGVPVITTEAYRIVKELGDKTGRTANVLMLGLLSTIEPFRQIPLDIWLSALRTISPSPKAGQINQGVFNWGRKQQEN
ncbi:MAG: 2-oxoacid:acceptor oxidoreductase family protein [Candidatus Omnitrophota bacterium]